MQRNLELEAAAFGNFEDLDSWRVFADWLQSTGDPRGELASLAINQGGAFLSERRNMAARIEAIQQPFVDAWQEWAKQQALRGVEVQFKRGFVFAVSGNLDQLRPVLDELFERNPIQQLTLTKIKIKTLTQLLEQRPAWLGRLRVLKLQGRLNASAVAALASIELAQLRRLNLIGTGIDARACKQLARLQTRALEHLILTANAIDPEALEILLGSPTRGQWRGLYLSQNPLDGVAVRMLASDDSLALTALYLSRIEAELREFAPFAHPDAIPTLTRLEIDGGGSRSAVLKRLRERFGSGLRLA